MTRPAVGVSNPAIIRRVVVFPDPDGPSIEKNSPSRTSRSTPSTATTSPNRFTTPSNRTAGAAGTGATSDRSSSRDGTPHILHATATPTQHTCPASPAPRRRGSIGSGELVHRRDRRGEASREGPRKAGPFVDQG